jgi:hypothetical protein
MDYLLQKKDSLLGVNSGQPQESNQPITGAGS